MANVHRGTWSVLLLGLVFHLVYIMSVFDCYFTSPVVHGMRHFSAGDAQAKRLVLFVADGLRSDLLYNLNPFPDVPGSPEVVAPFLRDVIESRGAFGVSHTHVPTESRPGHVAIIAGMYEDVSAVTKGWKTNPVNFDSVFNQSSHTFSFGSPDILPMFAHGAVPGKVDTFMYNEDDEDFTKDATELDIWVLSQLRALFNKASSDATLDHQLRRDQTVFFLHLLGLDTTGHSYRPHSKEYMKNIQVVDSIINQTEYLFQEFYNDNETSFIFTADHGMSNIGNHGDGNPDSTRTPLIAWGAGIRGPLPDTTPSSHDAYSETWSVNHLLRRDVDQADIAPLMTTVLGLNFPVNSIGVLPDIDINTDGYLDMKNGDEGKALAALANAKSILEHYRVKHQMKSSQKVFYTPFPGLATQDETGAPGSSHLLHIDSLLTRSQWKLARSEAKSLIDLSLRGLRYLETYDRSMLKNIVAVGYISWSAFSAVHLMFRDSWDMQKHKSTTPMTILTLFILFSFYALFTIQRESWTYYLYVFFPCYFLHETLLRLWPVIQGSMTTWSLRRLVPQQFRGPATQKRKGAIIPLFYTKPFQIYIQAQVALLIMVIAYTHRSLWSVGFIIIGIIWPIFSWPKTLKKIDPLLQYKWMAVCLICAIFPLRDVEQKEDLRLVASGGFAMIIAGAASLHILQSRQQVVYTKSMILQLILIALSIIITLDSGWRLSAKAGLPLANQVLGWVTLASSVVLPVLAPYKTLPPATKLLTLFLTFAPCFVILSICAEGLFYLSYCSVLVAWVEVETTVRNALDAERYGYMDTSKTTHNDNIHTQRSKEYKPRSDDVRIALFFLFFVQVAFFGTGNVASISSFYLEPVYRLVPVFNPFLMATLLIFKIVAPYVMLSAAFSRLNTMLEMPPFSLFLIALSLTDWMTIMFFNRVTDTGSWLEIGQSISFFVISSLLLVWSAGICTLGDWLMRPPEITDDSSAHDRGIKRIKTQ